MPEVGLKLHSNPCKHWTPPETSAIQQIPFGSTESASIVRSNISPGARGRFTPFYGLAPGKTGAES